MAGAGLKIGAVAGHVVGAGCKGGKVRVALLQADHQGVFIFRVYAQGGSVHLPCGVSPGVYQGEHVLRHRARTGIEGPGDGEHKVVGGDRVSVAPLSFGTEIKGELCGVLVGFPPAGYTGHRFPILVNAAEALEQGVYDHAGRSVCSGLRIQRGYILRQQVGEAAVRLIAPAPCAEAEKGQAQQQRDKSFSHGHSPFPTVLVSIRCTVYKGKGSLLFLTRKKSPWENFFPSLFVRKTGEKGRGKRWIFLWPSCILKKTAQGGRR